MKEIVNDVSAWLTDGCENIVVATVLRTWGSAPRRPGAKMALNDAGDLTGSVSGGCVEGAVIEVARDILESGESRLLHFGVADETAWNVGLACGGSIDIFVEILDLSCFQLAQQMIENRETGSIATIVRGPEDLFGQKIWVNGRGEAFSDLPHALEEQVSMVTANATVSGLVKLEDDVQVFVDLIRPSPMLVAVGGGEIAIALTRLAEVIGYNTIVVDPRRIFGSEERFPHADKIIQKWPRSAFAQIELTPDTAVALLTHDPKIDDPSLKIILNSDVFYIGALGSKRTHARRLKRLTKMGFTPQQTDRIHAPIGIDIGAVNPQEIATSILAEIIAARRGARNIV